MLLEALQRTNRGQKARVASIPVPIRGWSTADKYRGNLKYAPILTNWMLKDGRLLIRPGYAEYTTSVDSSADVETLMTYTPPSGTAELWGMADDSLYDVTSSGSAGSAISMAALTNTRSQHTLFSNSAGNWLVSVNGADALLLYDGTYWYPVTTTDVYTLDYDGGSGAWAVGETVTGAGGGTGVILAIFGDTTSGTLIFDTWNSTTFVNNESLTGSVAGAADADGIQALKVSALSGVAAGNLINVTAHQRRLWFAQKSSLSAWYGTNNAVSGTVAELDLGPLCKYGGSLQAIGSWSYDGGEGPDDYLVFVTSEGEIIIYSGYDPTASATFSLVGIYKTSKPLGRRCLVKYGSDLALLTESGVVLISDVHDEVGEADALSEPIRDEFIAAAADASSSFGWELVLYPKRGWLMANIPTNQSGTYRQFVYNPLMKAWFPFADLPARCWAELNGGMYFGGDSTTYAWDDGSTIDDDGGNVNADLQPTWWNYRTAAKKKFTLCRPNFFTDGTVMPFVSMRIDYDESPAAAAAETSEAPVGSLWGDSGGGGDLWDEGIWGGGLAAYSRWLTVSGAGIWGAPRIRVSTLTATVALTGIDVGFEVGGIV